MKIEYFKLVTGEDVISMAETTGDIVILKNPMIFAISREGVGMMPFAPFAKESKMSINKCHILAFGEPEDDIKNAYNSKFGSGIVLASSGKLKISS